MERKMASEEVKGSVRAAPEQGSPSDVRKQAVGEGPAFTRWVMNHQIAASALLVPVTMLAFTGCILLSNTVDFFSKEGCPAKTLAGDWHDALNLNVGIFSGIGILVFFFAVLGSFGLLVSAIAAHFTDVVSALAKAEPK